MSKVCVVTGATSGIGKATAIALAKEGYQLVLVGRDQTKLDGVKSELSTLTALAPVTVQCNLCESQSVQSAAANIHARFAAIDVLVNNAGAAFNTRQLNDQGHEMTFATNHLGPFEFTLRLLPLLLQAGSARIVNVSSNAHRMGGELDFDDLGLQNGFKFMKAYGRSKLANVYFSRYLAKQLAGRGVTVNALNPGPVNTNIGMQNNTWLTVVLNVITSLFFKSAEDGAKTSIYLAASPEVENITGRYFQNCRQKTLMGYAVDKQAAEQLWQVSESITGLSLSAILAEHDTRS